MKKEVIFAILVGFGIGLLITYGIYQAQVAYQKTSSAATTAPSPSPQPIPSPDLPQLMISSPNQQSIILSSPVTITGFSLPFAYISAVSIDDHVLVQADSSGNFSLDLELNNPATTVTLTSVSPDRQLQTSTDILLIYHPDNNQELSPEPDSNE